MATAPRRCHGFSLIEVLAAMVIFSTGAVILFGWISQTADRIGRLDREQRTLFGELTGLEYIRSVNPMLQPQGEIEIGRVRVAWSAEPVGDESTVRSGAGEGNYIVRLFRLQLRTEAESAAPAARALYLAGWREQAQSRRSLPFSNPAQPPRSDAQPPR